MMSSLQTLEQGNLHSIGMDSVPRHLSMIGFHSADQAVTHRCVHV